LSAVDAGRIHGYGVARPCREGYKIGPLFADDATIASALLAAVTASVAPGTPIYLDVPAPNQDAGVTSFELG
jgi:hypothetical protein